jgi:hypothetical protein
MDLALYLQRARTILADAVTRSGKSQNQIEAQLAVGHGWLRRVLDGSTDLKFKHILQLAQFLEFDPVEFFVLALRSPGGVEDPLLGPVKLQIEDIVPQPDDESRLSDKAKQAVRNLFLEELAKHGLLPAKVGSPFRWPGDDEPDPS